MVVVKQDRIIDLTMSEKILLYCRITIRRII